MAALQESVNRARSSRGEAADADGRLALRARRGLANLARIRSDFPAALAPGLEGPPPPHPRAHPLPARRHGPCHRRVRRRTDRSRTAQRPGRAGHRPDPPLPGLCLHRPGPCRRRTCPRRQLLGQLDQRATTLLAQVAPLVRDAGTNDVTDRAAVLRTEIAVAGSPGSPRSWRSPSSSTTPYVAHRMT
jgi:hypothetical protein